MPIAREVVGSGTRNATLSIPSESGPFPISIRILKSFTSARILSKSPEMEKLAGITGMLNGSQGVTSAGGGADQGSGPCWARNLQGVRHDDPPMTKEAMVKLDRRYVGPVP